MKINGDDVRYVPEKDMTSFSAVAHESRYLFVKNNFDLTNRVILDFGCGSGYGSYSLSENALSVDGIDYSKQAIDYAKKKYDRDNLHFYRLDATDLYSLRAINKQYDFITSFDVIEHIEHYFNYLNNTIELLKEDGTLVIGCPNRLQLFEYNKEWNIYHVQEFTPSQLAYVLSINYDEVELYAQNFSNEEAKNDARCSKQLGNKLHTSLQLLKMLIPTKLKARLKGLFELDARGRIFELSDISIKKENDLAVLNEAFGLLAVCKKPNPKVKNIMV